MNHDALLAASRSHPAWRLLRAEHAPFAIAFLSHAFLATNVRSIAQSTLIGRLDDYLLRLREESPELKFPRSASQYLDEWAADDHGWLRKYFPPDSDEPHFDLTPATEKAIAWVASLLEEKRFVATESRLVMLFDLLKQLIEGTETNPDVRVAELEKRRARIDQEIMATREGRAPLMDATQVRDRFLNISSIARSLLSDFREVEQNFRDLDRGVRERVAGWTGRKGELLEEILGRHDSIGESDQGRSFRAFWDFLMSPTRQAELSTMLKTVLSLEPVREMEPDPRLVRVHYDWLDAGESAQRTIAQLSQQLRRFLDDQSRLESRRIAEIIRSIEQHALAIRERAPAGPFLDIDDFAPDFALAMDRKLFAPPFTPTIRQDAVEEGDQRISVDALLDQRFIDRTRLLANIRMALQERDQVSLTEIVGRHPLAEGLAELVAYLAIASESSNTLIQDERRESVRWTDKEGETRVAFLPLVIFTR